jgi:hypothetical protein
MSSLQLFRSVKEVLSANSEATEEHIEKQDKVLNSLGTYFILNVVIIFKKSMTSLDSRISRTVLEYASIKYNII